MKTQHLIAGILAILVLSGYVLGQNGWTKSGSNVYLTTDTDKVGIGTNGISGKLHVDADNLYTALGDTDSFVITSLYQTGLRLRIGIYNSLSAAIQANYNDASAGKLLLNPFGGSVGIGTSSPTSGKLQVNTNALFTSVSDADAFTVDGGGATAQ